MATGQNTPYIVSQSFIKKYYKMLGSNPDELFRFYNEQSSFTHSYGPQPEPAVRGQANIRNKIASLNLAGTEVDLSNGSIDAQPSVDGGVFLTVTGTFTSQNDVPRPFVQSFFIAAQSGATANVHSYFVMNSVFRLLSHPVETHVVESHEPIVEKTVTPPAPEVEKVAPEATQQAAPQPTPTPAETEKGPAEAPVEEEEPEVEEQAVAAPPAQGGAPKSFLDALKKSLPATEAAPAPAPARRSKPAKGSPKATEAEAKEAKPTAAPATTALWVSNIADEATLEELRSIFAEFGPVRDVDLRQGHGYAFVEFESPAAVTAVLGSGKEFSLHSKQLKVEPKTSSKGGRKGGPKAGRAPGAKGGERREKPKETSPRREGNGAGKRSAERKEKSDSRPAPAAAAAKN